MTTETDRLFLASLRAIERALDEIPMGIQGRTSCADLHNQIWELRAIIIPQPKEPEFKP